jgi:hypothetical protein
MQRDPSFNLRHGKPGVLGEKGSASAFIVLQEVLDLPVTIPEQIIVNVIAARNEDTAEIIADIVTKTSDEFGLALTPDQHVQDCHAIEDGQTVHDFLVQWKQRANDARAVVSPQ